MMKRWLKITLLIVGALVLLGVAAGYWLSHRPAAPPETVHPTRQTITQDIDFTGRLEAKQTAKLGFETTGVATRVTVNVGDIVQRGQVLMNLDTRIGELELARALADRVSTVDTTKNALQTAQDNERTTTTANAQTLESARQTVRNAKRDLDQAKVVWQQTEHESGSDSSLTAARYSTVVSTESAYKAAQLALKETEKTVAKSNQATHDATVQAQTAYMNTQRASVSTSGLSALAATEHIAGVRLAQHTLTAPFTGVITEKNVGVGEVAVAGQPVLTVQTVDETQITSQVTETDSTKLRAGLAATVSLEAFDEQVTWPAEIVAIDPAAVLVEGVPTYKVTLQFVSSDERFRPGLTANVTVHVDKKDTVLTLPRRTIITQGTERSVRVLSPTGEISDKPVTTGLIGSDGLIEITSGLAESDNVIIRTASN